MSSYLGGMDVPTMDHRTLDHPTTHTHMHEP